MEPKITSSATELVEKFTAPDEDEIVRFLSPI